MGIQLTKIETDENGDEKVKASEKLIGIMSKYFTDLAKGHAGRRGRRTQN